MIVAHDPDELLAYYTDFEIKDPAPMRISLNIVMRQRTPVSIRRAMSAISQKQKG